jgi:hypothetical protein
MVRAAASALGDLFEVFPDLPRPARPADISYRRHRRIR